jgi:hypothetical protein
VPSVWPIPHVSTAYVLDLSDEQFRLKDAKKGTLMTPDAIVKNKVSD